MGTRTMSELIDRLDLAVGDKTKNESMMLHHGGGDSDSEELSEEVGYARISKAADVIARSASWQKEMKKLGVDLTPEMLEAMPAYIFPIVAAMVRATWGSVDGHTKSQAVGMLKAIQRSFVSEGE